VKSKPSKNKTRKPQAFLALVAEFKLMVRETVPSQQQIQGSTKGWMSSVNKENPKAPNAFLASYLQETLAEGKGDSSQPTT